MHQPDTHPLRNGWCKNDSWFGDAPARRKTREAENPRGGKPARWKTREAENPRGGKPARRKTREGCGGNYIETQQTIFPPRPLPRFPLRAEYNLPPPPQKNNRGEIRHSFPGCSDMATSYPGHFASIFADPPAMEDKCPGYGCSKDD